jgi:hypothetical protein
MTGGATEERLAGSNKLSAISYQLSAISYQLSAIGYQLSAIGYQLSAISYQLSDPSGSSPSRERFPRVSRFLVCGSADS